METAIRRKFGWQRGVLERGVLASRAVACAAGLALVIGATAGTLNYAAAQGRDDCGPAESHMGSARDALQGRLKDRGLESQQRAIDELQRCITQNDAKKALQDLQ